MYADTDVAVEKVVLYKGTHCEEQTKKTPKRKRKKEIYVGGHGLRGVDSVREATAIKPPNNTLPASSWTQR